MSKTNWCRVHRWISVGSGVFLLMWLTSGLVMILDMGFEAPRAPQAIDLRDVEVSPSEILQKLPAGAEVRWKGLKRVGDAVAYELSVDGATRLVNARSAQEIQIGEVEAETVLRAQYPAEGRLVECNLIDEYNGEYRWGALPAYRLVMENQPNSVYYVSKPDGQVTRVSVLLRVQRLMAKLHTFSALELTIENRTVKRILLWLASAIALTTLATGYFLALRRPREK